MTGKPTTTVSMLTQQAGSLEPRFNLIDLLRDFLPFLFRPKVSSVSPIFGPAGTTIVLEGSGFAVEPYGNKITVGGRPAQVIRASRRRLLAITHPETVTGPVRVSAGGLAGSAPIDFDVRGYPDANSGEDGPPIYFLGTGTAGAIGDVTPIGIVRVLVALVYSTDRVPSDPTTVRAAVEETWADTRTYYQQASYGKTDLQIDITTNWHVLDGPFASFMNGQNFAEETYGPILAQAAQAAVSEGKTVDSYDIVAAVVFTGTTFARGMGGIATDKFTYDNKKPAPDTLVINIPLTHWINRVLVPHNVDWGKCAHEIGHTFVSAPNFSGVGTATLTEDVYGSDLIDASIATAREFDIMGFSNSNPLFSGYHMEQLGYYGAGRILHLTWDGNPYSDEFDVVAHGLAEDATPGRWHLIRIQVGAGLQYYVEVRQRPGATAQVFDPQIPIDTNNPNQGGVIVTAAIAGTLNTNQQMRFLSLAHPEHVLQQGEWMEDPARGLKVTVVNGLVASNPMVCRVRVEWGEVAANDPNGTFDLSLAPWDASYQSPDIWVDRLPLFVYDNPLDSEGRPFGVGDKPRPLETNWLRARIHVSGPNGAKGVKVTFYAVFPPGIGDNGNWAPLGVQDVDIPANSYKDVFMVWTPVVGEHTCLQVHANATAGEITTGNNFAQENVGEFLAPANSPAEAVVVPLAVRNPLDKRAMVQIEVTSVPQGWAAHFPNRWVWLEPKAEKRLDLTVIPLLDYESYAAGRGPMTAEVKVSGYVLQNHETAAGDPGPPPARFYSIGGYTSRVHVRRRAAIRLHEGRFEGERENIRFSGTVSPTADRQRVIVRLVDPKGRNRTREVLTASDGSFVADFDLNFDPSPLADPSTGTRTRELISGTYVGRAAIFAASELVDVESNVVYVMR